MRIILTIFCVIALNNSFLTLAEEHQEKLNKEPSLIERIVEKNQHLSKRVIRHAFGGYGYGVGYSNVGDETATQPRYSARNWYGNRRPYAIRHSETFNRFRSAIIVK